MFSLPPTLRAPTDEEIREHAEHLYLDLTEDEIDDFSTLVHQLAMPLYERLDELTEPNLPIRFTDRDPGYRPDAQEDPYNAFVTKCEVGGADGGMLGGYTVGLKDNVSLAGVEMTCGSNLLAGYVPSTDATIVTWLLEAGATITGKLNMEALALSSSSDLSDYGAVLNPRNDDYLAGGSSSGSAAAVVSSDVDIAIGADQAGSIRIPASWCGCVGLKPTFGLVPYTGLAALGHSFDHAGPMTRSVEDCARVLQVIAGADPLDPRQNSEVEVGDYLDAVESRETDITFGVVAEGFDREESDPEVDETVRTALDSLEGAGGTTRQISIPWHRDGLAVWSGIAMQETTMLMETEGLGGFGIGFYDTQFANAFGRARRAQAEDLPPFAKFEWIFGRFLMDQYRGIYHAKAQNLRRPLTEAYDDALSDVDVLVMPTSPRPPHQYDNDLSRIEAVTRAVNMLGNTAPYNATGHPAITVRCGTANGLPVGLMVIGERFDDETVLRAADLVERTIDWEA